MNKNTRFNPLPYSRDDSMNHMEYEGQHEENHMIQSLGKHKHTKSQKIEIKSGKGERGRKRDLLKDVISTKKSFDYFTRTDYKRVHNLPPFIPPTNLDHLG